MTDIIPTPGPCEVCDGAGAVNTDGAFSDCQACGSTGLATPTTPTTPGVAMVANVPASKMTLTGLIGFEIHTALREYFQVRLGPELWDNLRDELNAGGMELTNSIVMNGIVLHRADHAAPKSLTIMMGGFVVSRVDSADLP